MNHFDVRVALPLPCTQIDSIWRTMIIVMGGGENTPHLYVKGTFQTADGDVVFVRTGARVEVIGDKWLTVVLGLDEESCRIDPESPLGDGAFLFAAQR